MAIARRGIVLFHVLHIYPSTIDPVVHRVRLRMLVTLLLLGVVTPSFHGTCLVAIDESKVPVETEDEQETAKEEYVAGGSSRMPSHHVLPSAGTVTLQRKSQASPTQRTASGVTGHRWSNGLLAPLTC